MNPVLQNQMVVRQQDSEKPTVQFLNRRTRFYFYGYLFDPLFSYKIQLRFEKDRQTLYDAAFKFRINPNFSFWVGQETLPAARSQLISLKNLQFVDRSIVHATFDLQKDIGVWAFYKKSFGTPQIKLAAAFSNGEGIFRAADTRGYSYTGRFDVLPFGAFLNGGDTKGADLKREPDPKLAVGIAYNINNNANAHRGQRGVTFPNNVTTDINTVFVDGIFKYRGMSAMVEWISRTTSDPILTAAVPVFKGNGFTAQSGYLFKNDIEVALRYAGIFPDKEIEVKVSEEKAYTLAVSRYFSGHHLKLQCDLTYRQITGFIDNNFIQFRTQLSVNF